MNTCKTCSFWKRFGNICELETNFCGGKPLSEMAFRSGPAFEINMDDPGWRGERSKILSERESHLGNCSCEKLAYFTSAFDTQKDELGFVDGEGCGARMWTGEDFGCIHHKSKE